MTNLKLPEVISEINLNIQDLRKTDHPEYNQKELIEDHFWKAYKMNGLRIPDDSIFKRVNKKPKLKKVGLAQKYYNVYNNMRGVYKHPRNSFDVYESYIYETLDYLLSGTYIKHNDSVYIGKNGYCRMELIRKVSELCEELSNPKVLEVGCGSGLNLYLLNRLNPNIELHGFEYTSARLASAILNLYTDDMVNNLFLADATDMKLEDNSYDYLYSIHVMEQLGQEGAELAMKEMWRVCRKGIVMIEPSVIGANFYEKWRVKKMGYCEDLVSIAENLPNSNIVISKEATYRSFPNTGYFITCLKK